MPVCCVSGCKNRYPSTVKLRFYKIPSAYRPFLANRRRLWLKAIEQANGSVLKLKPSIRICGAHFTSGKTIDCFHKTISWDSSRVLIYRMQILFLHEKISVFVLFDREGIHELQRSGLCALCFSKH